MSTEKDYTSEYEAFIEKIVASQKVYTLHNEKGEYATCYSVDYEDEDGEEIDVLCFWSDKKLANACKVDEWTDNQVEEIPLAEFIEEWCVGMFHDFVLVGVDFDNEMEGYEADAMELIIDIVRKLEDQEIELSFKRFKDLTDVKEQIDEMLLGDEIDEKSIK